MATYFTSDLHFGHRLMLKIYTAFRKGADTDEMDEALIAQWNATVSPQDTVYNLGDVSFRKFADTYQILRRLNGKHILILGNHDEQIEAKKEELLKQRKDDGNPVFSEITDYKRITLEPFCVSAVLSHYPMFEWDACHRGGVMLYGHLHQNLAEVKGRILNVGYDLHGKILSTEEIWEYLKDIKPRGHHKADWASNNDTIEARRKAISENICEINKILQ